MKNYRNDPTANTAIGSVDRELSRRRKEAERAARLIRRGRLTLEEEMRIRARFTGIFRRALEDALEKTDL